MAFQFKVILPWFFVRDLHSASDVHTSSIIENKKTHKQHDTRLAAPSGSLACHRKFAALVRFWTGLFQASFLYLLLACWMKWCLSKLFPSNTCRSGGTETNSWQGSPKGTYPQILLMHGYQSVQLRMLISYYTSWWSRVSDRKRAVSLNQCPGTMRHDRDPFRENVWCICLTIPTSARRHSFSWDALHSLDAPLVVPPVRYKHITFWITY